MVGTPKPDTPVSEKVSCTECHREVPRADAIKDEGEDYLRWFCGFTCYHTWHKQHGPDH